VATPGSPAASGSLVRCPGAGPSPAPTTTVLRGCVVS
jgi:hypothetical protein